MCNKNLRHALELLLAPQRSPAVLPLTNNIPTTIACDQRARNPCMFPAEPIQTKACYFARSETKPIFPIDKTWTLTKPKINKKLKFSARFERFPADETIRVRAAKMAYDASTHLLSKRLLKQLFAVRKVFCCFIAPPAVSEGKRIDECFKFGSSGTRLVGMYSRMYSIVNWFLEGKSPAH